MTWKAYSIIPIDWSWEYLPTVEDVAQMFAKNDATLALNDVNYDPIMLPDFFQRFETAKQLASGQGWEGDYQGGAKPRVFFLPSENDFEYGFAWKQSNNGTTFVVSPYPLPWLDRLG